MADDNTPQNLPAVQRQKAIVADTIPVFDTNRFEHYGRIATVLADSSLVPDTLKDRNDRQVSIANCFQVVELADRFGYSPFAVAQCASVVHGKLMLEGKLVAAVLSTKLGLQLHHYYTGEWGSPDYRIFVTDRELTESEVAELKPHQKLHGVRMVDGSVKEWQTFEKNSTNPKGNWKNQPDMQLLYRGDRTWARAYESAVMLGVYTEDEFDELQDRRLTPQEQPSLTAGFTGEKPARTPRKPKDAPAATEPADNKPEGAHADAQGAGDGDHVHDAEFEDGSPSTNGVVESEAGVDASQTEGEQGGAEPSTATESSETTSEPTQTVTTASSTDTSATAAPTASGSSSAERVVHPEETRAPAGELYCLINDEPDENGRVPTYKDGVGFSRVKVDSKSKPQAYFAHPLADDDASEASGEGEKQDTAGGEQTHPFIVAISAIREAKTFLSGKQVVKTLAGGEHWSKADEPAKAHVRQSLWERYEELRDNGEESTAPYEDFMLMRLFVEFGASAKAEIDALWPKFWKGPYKQANEADQRAITDLMTARKAVLP